LRCSSWLARAHAPAAQMGQAPHCAQKGLCLGSTAHSRATLPRRLRRRRTRRRRPPATPGSFASARDAADMLPGGRTSLDFATSRGCEGGTRRGTTYRDLVFRLQQGGSVRAGKNVVITEVCGLSMSAFGLRPRPLRQSAPRPGTAGTLTAQLAAPAAVRAAPRSNRLSRSPTQLASRCRYLPALATRRASTPMGWLGMSRSNSTATRCTRSRLTGTFAMQCGCGCRAAQWPRRSLAGA
jgi:hypothetical protein